MNLFGNNISYSNAKYFDFAQIKSLMLRALKEDPFAFSVDFEEYQYNSDEWWNNYIAPYTSGFKDKMFLAKDKEQIVGMIGTLYEYKSRRKHAVSIVWFYVDESHRNKGIGKMLMDMTLDDINKNKDIMKIFLLVNGKQKSAISLYTKLGFKQNGILEKEYRINGEFVDSYVMEKILV